MSETFSSADFVAATSPEPVSSPEGSAAPSVESSSTPSSEAPTSAASESDELTDPSWGQIPQSRRPKILENARAKARAEAEASFKEKFGWAETLDQNEAQLALRVLNTLKTNPVQAVGQQFKALLNDPQHGASIRSFAASLLGSRQAQAQPQTEDARPEPDIPTSDSNGVPVVYSARQQEKLLEWQARQIERRMMEQLAPRLKTVEDIETERQTAAMKQRADTWAEKEVSRIEKMPGFKDHKAEIATLYSQMPMDGRTEGEKLRDAYLQVVSEKVIPSLDSSARSAVVADINRKANAGTVNPGAASAASAPKNWRDKDVPLQDALRMAWEESHAR